MTTTPEDFQGSAPKAAVSILRSGIDEQRLILIAKEKQWLDRIERELDSLPAAESELLAEMREQRAHEFDPSSYGLKC